MHFDDRLETVLRQPVRGREIARVQYVQLLDLLGKTAAVAQGNRLDPAYTRLTALGSELAAPQRAQLLRESGLILRSPALVAFLADDDPSVASSAIAAADLGEQEWMDLIPALPVRSRGIMRHRRDLGPVVEARLDQLGVADRGLPPVEQNAVAADEPVTIPRLKVVASPPPPQIAHNDADGPNEGETGIGALVRKIEAYRKARPMQPPPPATDAPRLPLGDPDQMPLEPAQRFDFATDSAGRIVRADGQAAPMLVGTAIATLACRPIEGPAPSPAEALRLRQPIDGQVVAIDGAPAISGDWQIDAAPVFDAATGRYIGHAGRARRLSADALINPRINELADRMRQVLHELRNPAGAIQMASEFIQQQVGGTVSHEYRAIAAAIAGDSASVLAGLDELDRMVKLDAGAASLEPGETDIAATIAETATLLGGHLAQRQGGFVLDLPETRVPVAIARGDVERLAWRLLAAVTGAAGPGEQLALRLIPEGDSARLEIALPAGLRDLSDEDLFAAQARSRGATLSAGSFGLGFTLRLAAAEARSAGGSLRRDGSSLILALPTGAEPSAKIRSR